MTRPLKSKGVTFVRLDPPILGRRRALSEKSFVQIVLKEGLTEEEARKKYNFSHHTWHNSMNAYKKKYAKKIREWQYKHYARSKWGNRYGQKEKPAVVLEKELLADMLRRRMGLYQIAEALDVSAWFVRENIKLHDLSLTDRLPIKMQKVDLAFLERLEPFCHGITVQARAYYENPHLFFQKLYKAYIRLNELVWFVKEQAAAHAYYVEKGVVPRDHICWSPNRGEMRLSLGLLEKKVPHIRQYTFHGNYVADFAFPGTALLVEVDGDYHRKDTATKRRDKRRAAKAQELGYKVLHFTDKEVFADLPHVVRFIRAELRALRKLNVSAVVPSGTSKSKKTTRTKRKVS